MKKMLNGLIMATLIVPVLIMLAVVGKPEIWIIFFNELGTWIWSMLSMTFFSVPLWVSVAAYILLSLFTFSLIPRSRAKSLSWSEKPIRKW